MLGTGPRFGSRAMAHGNIYGTIVLVLYVRLVTDHECRIFLLRKLSQNRDLNKGTRTQTLLKLCAIAVHPSVEN